MWRWKSFFKGNRRDKAGLQMSSFVYQRNVTKPSSSFFPSTLVSLFHLYPFSHWTTKHAAAASTLLNAHQTRKIDWKFWKRKKKERMKLTHQHDGEERKKMRKKVRNMLIHTLRKTERYSLVKLRKREKQRERERERGLARTLDRGTSECFCSSVSFVFSFWMHVYARAWLIIMGVVEAE
jgi:hypothetical protein